MQKIKQIRLQKNIKQADLARQAKMSRATLSDIENGIRYPRGNELERIAIALDVKESDLTD